MAYNDPQEEKIKELELDVFILKKALTEIHNNIPPDVEVVVQDLKDTLSWITHLKGIAGSALNELEWETMAEKMKYNGEEFEKEMRRKK